MKKKLRNFEDVFWPPLDAQVDPVRLEGRWRRGRERDFLLYHLNFVASKFCIPKVSRLLTREVSICGGGKTQRRRMRFAARPVGSTPSPTVHLRSHPRSTDRCASRVASAVVAVASAPTPTDSLSLFLARVLLVDPLDRWSRSGPEYFVVYSPRSRLCWWSLVEWT